MIGAGRVCRAALACAAVTSLSAGLAQAEPARCGLTPEQVYAQAEPAVAQVFSLTIDQFRVAGRVLPSFGSGFRLEDGIYVTNYHVVADASQVVIFTDGATLDAEVVAADPVLDIAVLRPIFDIFDGSEPSTAALQFADPASAAVGQAVYALGYPLGLGKSLTQGIVTGLGRVSHRQTTAWLSPMVQTNAAVNPGNSGGPFLDDCGKVVGMISDRLTPDVAENAAFAIPVQILAPAIDELVATGRISRPWHGLYGQMTTPPILMILGAPMEAWEEASGFLVETVEPGSAADQLGLHGGYFPVVWGGSEFLLGGDIITEVDGRRITDRDTALDVVRGLKVGQTVHLVYLRDGERMEGDVTLPERPVLPQDLERYRGEVGAP